MVDFLPLLLLWASNVSNYLLPWFGHPSPPLYSNAALRGRVMLEIPQQPHHHQPPRSSHMHALVEMAYICDPQNTTQTDRARAFVAGAFGAADPPAWHLFPAIHGPPGGCPTVAFTDKHAWPAKGIGTTLAHTLVWREFVRRHHHRHGYLVVFENDVVCAVDNCGAAIKKALAQAKSAFVFLGWCSMLADADPRTTQTPPWCLHGYALTAHAARYDGLLGLPGRCFTTHISLFFSAQGVAGQGVRLRGAVGHAGAAAAGAACRDVGGGRREKPQSAAQRPRVAGGQLLAHARDLGAGNTVRCLRRGECCPSNDRQCQGHPTLRVILLSDA